MKYLLVFLAIALLSESVSADCEDDPPEYIRKCFDKSNAPPGLLYQLFVDSVFYESLEPEEHRATRRYVEAGLTPNMNSADVVRYFIPRFLEILEELEETQRRMLCLDEEPRYEGAENFIVLDQLDEMALTIYEKHYFIAKSDLSASGLFDLDKALKEYPGVYSLSLLDHEKFHGGSIQQAHEHAADLCRKPRRYEFISSEGDN